MADDVRGWDSLMAKMSRLTGPQIEAAAKDAALKCAMANEAAAKLLAPTDSGELKFSGIRATVEIQNGEAVGICFTSAEHAAFVEFGTGPVGQASGGNGSPVPVSYSLGPFKVKRGTGRPGEVAESYEDYWVYYDEARSQFFATKGQPAQPFMYPSAMEIREQAKSIQAAALRKFLKNLGV